MHSIASIAFSTLISRLAHLNGRTIATRETAAEQLLNRLGLPYLSADSASDQTLEDLLATIGDGQLMRVLPFAAWHVVTATQPDELTSQHDELTLAAVSEKCGPSSAEVQMAFLAYARKTTIVGKDVLEAYRGLGLSPPASPEEITRRYRHQSKAHHPDAHPHASPRERLQHEKQMKQLNLWYGLLVSTAGDITPDWHVLSQPAEITRLAQSFRSPFCPVCASVNITDITPDLARSSRCFRCRALLAHDRDAMARLLTLRQGLGVLIDVFTKNYAILPPTTRLKDLVQERLTELVHSAQGIAIPALLVVAPPVAVRLDEALSPEIPPLPVASRSRRQVRMVMRLIAMALPVTIVFSLWWGVAAALLAAALLRRAYELANEEHEQLTDIIRAGMRPLRAAAAEATRRARTSDGDAKRILESATDLVESLRKQKADLLNELSDSSTRLDTAAHAWMPEVLAAMRGDLVLRLLEGMPVEEAGIDAMDASLLRSYGIATAKDLEEMQALPGGVPGDLKRKLLRWLNAALFEAERVSAQMDVSVAMREAVNLAVASLCDRVASLSLQCKQFQASSLSMQEQAQQSSNLSFSLDEHARRLKQRIQSREMAIEVFQEVRDRAFF